VSDALIAELRTIVGQSNVLTDADMRATYENDWLRQWDGETPCVVRPSSVAEVAAVVRVAAAAGVPVVPIVVSSLKPHIDLARRQAEPTTITIHVLAPRVINASEDAIRSAVAATRQTMIAAYREMSAETVAVTAPAP